MTRKSLRVYRSSPTFKMSGDFGRLCRDTFWELYSPLYMSKQRSVGSSLAVCIHDDSKSANIRLRSMVNHQLKQASFLKAEFVPSASQSR